MSVTETWCLSHPGIFEYQFNLKVKDCKKLQKIEIEKVQFLLHEELEYQEQTGRGSNSWNRNSSQQFPNKTKIIIFLVMFHHYASGFSKLPTLIIVAVHVLYRVSQTNNILQQRSSECCNTSM